MYFLIYEELKTENQENPRVPNVRSTILGRSQKYQKKQSYVRGKKQQ